MFSFCVKDMLHTVEYLHSFKVSRYFQYSWEGLFGLLLSLLDSFGFGFIWSLWPLETIKCF